MTTVSKHRLIALLPFVFFAISCRPPVPTELSIDDIDVSILQPLGKKSSVETINRVIDTVEHDINALDPLEGTVLGALNDSEVGEVIEMGDLSGVLTDCMKYTEESFGAFDPTLQILWDVYDFDLGGRFVSDEELADALTLVDYTQIEIDGNGILRKADDVRMGLGPAIEGAIVDLFCEQLNSDGIEWDMIRAGDTVAVNKETVFDFYYPLDERNSGSDMRLMGHIRMAPGEFLGAIDDEGQFFFTHGEYFHEVINPIQGKPVEGLRAALVLCDESAVQASIFAYAVMAMGVERGIEFLNETEGVEGLVVDEDGGVVVSSELAERFWR